MSKTLSGKRHDFSLVRWPCAMADQLRKSWKEQKKIVFEEANIDMTQEEQVQNIRIGPLDRYETLVENCVRTQRVCS